MRELNEQNYDISYWKENSSTNENELMEMKRLEKQYEYLVNDNSKLN